MQKVTVGMQLSNLRDETHLNRHLKSQILADFRVCAHSKLDEHAFL
jgi:hypothetical protein